MSFDYLNEIVPEVLEVLKEFGKTIVVSKPGVGAVYDPVTMTTTPGSPATTVNVDGVTLEPTQEYIESLGGNLQATDQMVYLAPTVEPKMEDSLIIEGVEWSIINIKAVRPATVAVLYIVQVRP